MRGRRAAHSPTVIPAQAGIPIPFIPSIHAITPTVIPAPQDSGLRRNDG